MLPTGSSPSPGDSSFWPVLVMTKRFESMIHPRTAEPDLGGMDAPIPEGKLGVGEFVAR